MTINFYLDQVYKPNVTKQDVKDTIKKGKSINKLLSTKETSIYLIVSFPGRRLVKVRVPEKIRPIDWNFESKLPKPSMHGYLELADRLSFLKAEVLRQYRSAVNQNSEVMTLEHVKELVNAVIEGKTPQYNKKSFLEVLDEFIEERKHSLRKNTNKKYKAFRSIITDFWTKRKIKPSTFVCDSVNDDFQRKFMDYFINDRKLLNNSIGKYFIVLRTVMTWAKRKKYHSTDAYLQFPVYREKVDVIYLSLAEIELIRNVDLLATPGLDRCRDCFTFQLICGQRYSDLENLRAGDFIFNNDGTVDLRIHQLKGGRTVATVIPVAQVGVEILRKYKVQEMEPDAYALPVISNQKYNEAIKEICKKASINELVKIVSYRGTERIEQVFKKYELISSHSARKSHISLAAQSGISVDVISSVTGNSPAVMRNHYLAINLETKRKAIDKVFGDKSES
jgi:integrase